MARIRVFIPDGTYHTWCYGATMTGRPNLKDAIQYALSNMEQQTKMTASNPEGCGDSVDMLFRELYINGNRGQYDCRSWSSSNPYVCTKAFVEFDVKRHRR